jgi:hypothetical protein
MIDVVVNPRDYQVDRSLRLFCSEGELLRRTVRFAPTSPASYETGARNPQKYNPKVNSGSMEVETPPVKKKIPTGPPPQVSTEYDSTKPWKKYVRCSNPDVVCNLVDDGVRTILFFKVRLDLH